MVLYVCVHEDFKREDHLAAVLCCTLSIRKNPKHKTYVLMAANGKARTATNDNSPSWFIQHMEHPMFFSRPFDQDDEMPKEKKRKELLGTYYKGAKFETVYNTRQPMICLPVHGWRFPDEIGGFENFLRAIYIPERLNDVYFGGTLDEIAERLRGMDFDSLAMGQVTRLMRTFLDIDRKIDEKRHQAQCLFMGNQTRLNGSIEIFNGDAEQLEFKSYDMSTLCGGEDWLSHSTMRAMGQRIASFDQKTLFFSPQYFSDVLNRVKAGRLDIAMERAQKWAKIAWRQKPAASGRKHYFSRVVGFVHISGTHWVAYAMDRHPKPMVTYVDSFGHAPRQDILNTMCVLQRELLPPVNKKKPPVFMVEWANLNGQEDEKSCGLFSIWEAMVFTHGVHTKLDPVYYVGDFSTDCIENSKRYILDQIIEIFGLAEALDEAMPALMQSMSDDESDDNDNSDES